MTIRMQAGLGAPVATTPPVSRDASLDTGTWFDAATPHGVVPTTAKVGIDATIGEGIPKERFERIAYAYADTARIGDYVKGKADISGKAGDEKTVTDLAAQILKAIAEKPLYYTEVAERFAHFDFQTVARALGHLHATQRLWQDTEGRMCERGSKFAAKRPGAD